LGGPVNFRDLGGYPTGDGGEVPWGKVYRSDSLHHLTVDDGPRLAQIGITSAIDFRADDELDRIGIGRLGQLEIRHVHLPTVDRALHTVRPPNWEPPESAAAVYGLMLRTGAAAYAEALRTLAGPDALPAVYFCMAGKDRTGVFTAVLLGLLGVSDADIVADYALTHEVVDQIHARREAAERQTDDEEESVWRDLPADLLGAHAATMEGTLEILRTEWGGVRGYVDGIGVSGDVVDRLRAALITDGEGAP
jgi:protein-tyrosine phosphatase